MAGNTRHTPDQIIQAIKGTGGIKTTVAKRLDVTRQTVDNYLRKWASVNEAYIEECEAITDMAEANLIQEIRDRNFQAIRFYLQTKGKERGYVERQEISGADGQPMVINMKWGDNAASDND
jgi:predicted transcriptional regulator